MRAILGLLLFALPLSGFAESHSTQIEVGDRVKVAEDSYALKVGSDRREINVRRDLIGVVTSKSCFLSERRTFFICRLIMAAENGRNYLFERSYNYRSELTEKMLMDSMPLIKLEGFELNDGSTLDEHFIDTPISVTQ